MASITTVVVQSKRHPEISGTQRLLEPHVAWHQGLHSCAGVLFDVLANAVHIGGRPNHLDLIALLAELLRKVAER